MKPIKAEFILFLVTFIWGGTFMFTKLGLQDCPPALYIIFRFCIALTISLIAFGRYLPRLDKKTMKAGLILGLLFGGGFVLQTYGLKMTSVSKSAFITGMTVPLTPFAFMLIQRKKVKFWPKIGVVIATIGLWVFTKPEFDNINLGDVITLISTAFWAFYITLMDLFTKGETEFHKTALNVMFQFIAAASVAIVTFLAMEMDTLELNLTSNLIMSLAYNGILASFMVTFIHTTAQRYTTPVKAALIFSLEPVIASVVAIIFLGEVLGMRELTGGAILLLGVITSEAGAYIFGRRN